MPSRVDLGAVFVAAALLACGAHGGLDDDEDAGTEADHVPCLETIFVPGGTFTMGLDPLPEALVYRGVPECDWNWAQGAPAHDVLLSGYWVQRYETTTRCFAECVDAGQCQPIASLFLPEGYSTKPSNADRPTGWVRLSQAAQYCAFRGGSLPTEAQWEKAARGLDGWAPQGAEISCETADIERLFGYRCAAGFEPGEEAVLPLPIPERPLDESPFGVRGVLGGVQEWVRDFFDPFYYQTGGPPWSDPLGPDLPPCPDVRGMLRGGGFHGVLSPLTDRGDVFGCDDTDCYGVEDHGVRCVWEDGPPPPD